jgi:DNA (cytosine-5)-methyltransferase 1
MAALTFLEFFAGGGLARLGLGASWRCLFANDVDPRKCAAYRENFGPEHLVEADIARLGVRDLPSVAADLAWASFPCQDLSLAGARGGLSGARSGTFFAFARLMADLKTAGHAPRTVVVENVTGLLTSKGGADFAAVADEIAGLGFRLSAIVLNASSFVPQSRPRLFIFGFSHDALPIFSAAPLRGEAAPPALLGAVARLSPRAARSWRWLAAEPPASVARWTELRDLVDLDSPDWSADRGQRALAMMSARQRAAVTSLIDRGESRVGAAFFRVRREDGRRVQRLEARFDGLAGCLRTPAGGSSRQLLLMIEGEAVRARRLTPREAARLMGAPDAYRLPVGATDALKLMGDGVAPPVVRWIADRILEPALLARAAAA